MITKITNTPNNYRTNLLNQNQYYTNANNTKLKFNSIQQDNVSFNGKKTPELNNIINKAFDILSKNRNGSKHLGTYHGTSGKTNFSLYETEFGKKATLNVVRNNEFANYEISKTSNKSPQITLLDKEVASKNITEIVNRFLTSMK